MSTVMNVLLDDTQRLLERRARPAPPVPVSRADQIIAEGDRRRVSYRCLNPDADTAMIYGAQVGYLHGMVRKLAAEADTLAIRRDPNLQYLTLTCGDIAAEWIVGCTYTPGEPAQIWGPPENCHEGSPEELEISEVWCNGLELSAALKDEVLEQIEDATLERMHQLQDRASEWSGE